MFQVGLVFTIKILETIGVLIKYWVAFHRIPLSMIVFFNVQKLSKAVTITQTDSIWDGIMERYNSRLKPLIQKIKKLLLLSIY